MDREVSWGEEAAVEEQIQVPAKISEPKIQEKKEKEPLATPGWSVDTRGDLPTERALGSSVRSEPAAPGWPEEETQSAAAPASNYGNRTASNYGNSSNANNYGSNANNYGSNANNYGSNANNYGSNANNYGSNANNYGSNESLPPLTRRVGRDPVSVPGEFRDSRGPREYREPREPRGNDSNGAPGPGTGPRRSRIDDLSTLNLPGVDLSKMPSSSTPLPFSNNNNNRREQREDRNESYDRSDSYEKVNRVTREVEEMGWGDEPVRAAEPVREFARVSETVKVVSNSNSRLEDNGWGDEPEPVRAAEPVRVAEPARAAEPIRQPEPVREPTRQAAPIKVVNAIARLDDDGWGDEPETAPAQIAEPVRIAEPVKVSEPARIPEPVKVSEPARIPEPVKVREPVKIAEAVRQPEPVKPAEPIRQPEPVTVVPSASSDSFVPAAFPPTAFPPMMMPAYPQFAQMSQNGAPAPSYMMSPHNPMSPVGQMPMSVPMSCMSGMMMPFWVTCPFCYHCYMYPPVVPGSGPAPGAATLPSNTQQQQN